MLQGTTLSPGKMTDHINEVANEAMRSDKAKENTKEVATLRASLKMRNVITVNRAPKKLNKLVICVLKMMALI